MSTAMRDFYKSIALLECDDIQEMSYSIVKSYFDNLTEEEQEFVNADMNAEVCDAINC